MKFLITKKKLENQLNIANLIVRKKNIDPSLMEMEIETNMEKQEIALYISDREIYLKQTLPANIMEEGSVFIRASLFRDIVQACPGEEIAILREPDQNACIISAVGYKYESSILLLESTGNSDTRKSYEKSHTPTFQMTSQDLASLFSQVLPFASKEDVRITFHSLFLEKRENDLSLRAVCSDTRRLAIAKTHQAQVESSFSALIPMKAAEAIKEIARSYPADEMISYYHKEGSCVIETSHTILETPYISGKFPDYESVIPKTTSYHIEIGREDFLNMLKSMEPFLSNSSAKIEIMCSQNTLTVTAENKEIGKGIDSKEISYEGEDLSVSFNERLLKEIIQVIPQDNIWMRLENNNKPMIVSAANPTPSDPVYICIPLA